MNPPKSLEWLRKQAKRHLAELRKSKPDATLSDAQLDIVGPARLVDRRAAGAR